MKIHKWIEHSEEIEIEIDAEDISMIFKEGSEENINIALNNLNSIFTFLIGLPNEVIEKIHKRTIELIARHLKEQAERFEQFIKDE